MALNIIHYHYDGKARWGVISNGCISEAQGEFPSTSDFIRNTDINDLKNLGAGTLSVNDVTLLSPVTRNQRFVCQGANYRQHMIESGMDPDVKSYNMIFTKATSCIVAANSDVIRPSNVRFLDYEVELGLVIRKPITSPVKVTDDNLHEYVAGAVIVNDYSARDIQIPQMQFYKGKSFRTFGPVGPWLTLLEPADYPLLKHLLLELRVNGEIRQQDSTQNMVYGPSETLSELSSVHDFDTGDLLATGTPAGCALAVPSPTKQRIGAMLPEKKKWEIFFKVQSKRPYLRPGDHVQTSIRSRDGTLNLGEQSNRVVQQG